MSDQIITTCCATKEKEQNEILRNKERERLREQERSGSAWNSSFLEAGQGRGAVRDEEYDDVTFDDEGGGRYVCV